MYGHHCSYLCPCSFFLKSDTKTGTQMAPDLFHILLEYQRYGIWGIHTRTFVFLIKRVWNSVNNGILIETDTVSEFSEYLEFLRMFLGISRRNRDKEALTFLPQNICDSFFFMISVNFCNYNDYWTVSLTISVKRLRGPRHIHLIGSTIW